MQKYEETKKIGEWVRLSKTNTVRVLQLEDLQWELSAGLNTFHVAACPFGGPIALAKKGTSLITLYTSAGDYYTEIGMPEGDVITYMCWNEIDDHLIVVSQNGNVSFFEVSGEKPSAPVFVKGAHMCAPTRNGIIIVTEFQEAVLLECSVSGEYRKKTVKIPGLAERPSAVVAIPASVSDSGYDEALIAPREVDITTNTTVFHAIFRSNPCCVDLRLSIEGGSVVLIALSPSSQTVAFITEEGFLYRAPRDFKKFERVLDTETDIIPTQLMWCGEKCVCYVHQRRQFHEDDDYDTTVNFVDMTVPEHPEKENMEAITSVPEVLVMAMECDGIRILSEDSHYFIQVATPPALRIYQAESIAPAKLLVGAFDQYMQHNANSVPTMQEMANDDMQSLTEAIDDCIITAGWEFDVDQQKRLLRVASFGKCFCPNYDTDAYVNMTRRLRALHSVREVGMVLSMKQFTTLEGERLSNRLVAHEHYQLAFSICDYLDLKPHVVMVQWGKQKVHSYQSDVEVAKSIISKFRLCRGISFAGVALSAHAAGKEELSIRLLEADPSDNNKIQMLLEIHQDELALQKAIECGNPDLIFMVVIRLIGQRGGAAVPLIVKDPVARDMLLSFCISCESQRYLLEQYYRDNAWYEMHLALLQYFKEDTKLKKHLERKKDGWDLLQQCKISAIQTAELSCKKTDEGRSASRLLKIQQDLLDEQAVLATATNDLNFLNASVSETIRLCWVYNKGDKAEKMKSQLGVGDKMYWWAKLRALVDASDWDAVDKMGGVGRHAGKVKSPIGFIPFIKELLRANRKEQAALFVPKVPAIEDRLEYWLLCDDWSGAVDDCVRVGDAALLEQLKDRAFGNDKALEIIEHGHHKAAAKPSGLFKF